jgi:hypothetical protein
VSGLLIQVALAAAFAAPIAIVVTALILGCHVAECQVKWMLSWLGYMKHGRCRSASLG